MGNPDFEILRQHGEALLERARTGTPLHTALNDALSESLSWPYAISQGLIKDSDGVEGVSFDSIIHTSPKIEETVDHLRVENVACVIHSVPTLTLQSLSDAYSRISQFKALKRTALPQTGFPRNDSPIAIVVALDSDKALEEIAEDIQQINISHPSRLWPDMVVVLSKGTINYATQLEGEEIGGSFILPNLTDFPPMPMYIHLFGRSIANGSFVRLCALVFLQLQIFSPGSKVPDLGRSLPEDYAYGMSLGAYQFNRSGELVVVPTEMYREHGAGLRNLPWRIETQSGEIFSHVRFIPWQDGGVIRIYGKLPLEAFLVFLGREMTKAHKYKTADGLMTSVLNLDKNGFKSMLISFQNQSNMRVRPVEPTWTVSKFSDEGSSSPFMARLFLTLTHFRDSAVKDETAKKQFDKAFESTLMTLLNVRDTAKLIKGSVQGHKEDVLSGKSVRLVGKQIHIDAPIDKDLRKNFNDFVMTSVRVMKQGVQDMSKSLGFDIGFLFKKKNTFEKAIASLSVDQPELAAYLLKVRTWSEPLVDLRNDIDHNGWLLPKFDYRNIDGSIQAVEPALDGKTLEEFVQFIFDRLCCFVEDISVHSVQRKITSALSVTEIPIAKRDPARPERFRFAFAQGGLPLWKISYSDCKFLER